MNRGEILFCVKRGIIAYIMSDFMIELSVNYIVDIMGLKFATLECNEIKKIIYFTSRLY